MINSPSYPEGIIDESHYDIGEHVVAIVKLDKGEVRDMRQPWQEACNRPRCSKGLVLDSEYLQNSNMKRVHYRRTC